MGSPVLRYQQEMHENLGFFATWLPGDLLDLGDIGVLVDGSFRKRSTLRELGVDYKESSFGAPQNLNLTSKAGTNLSVDTSVDSSKAVEIAASIKIEFSSRGAFLFQASNVRNKRIEITGHLTDSILERWRRGGWDTSWLILDSLHHADCATVIVSDEGAAGVSFNAKGAIGSIPLAEPQLNLSISSSRGRMFQVIAGRSLRPLYSCLRVSQGWFSEPSVETVRGESKVKVSPFSRPPIDELLRS